MAAETGNTYIFGTMIDSIDIPTADLGFSTMTLSRPNRAAILLFQLSVGCLSVCLSHAGAVAIC